MIVAPGVHCDLGAPVGSALPMRGPWLQWHWDHAGFNLLGSHKGKEVCWLDGEDRVAG